MTVTPLCPYFASCGGCQLQHLSYAEQLQEKQRWLANIMVGIVSESKIRDILASPQEWNYRSRVQLHVGPKGEVGFYETRSRKVVDVERCLIADEKLNAKIPEVRALAAEVLKQPRRPTSLTYELTLGEAGQVEIVREGGGRSFLQVNPGANRLLIEALRSALAEAEPARILELFAGSGNLSYALAKPEQVWVAVENDRRAVEKAQEQQGSAFPSMSWQLGAAAKVAARLFQTAELFDLVLLDPPRGGAEDCLPVFRKAKPPRIFYVSCNPLALRKDLQVLRQAGYETEFLQPIDFFPQTQNLEVLAALRQK